MVTENELRWQLAALLNDELSLDAFEDWFTAASWNAHQDSSPAAQRLVGAIELRLDEYSNGHLSSAELNRELKALVFSEPIKISRSLNTDIGISLTLNLIPDGPLRPDVVAWSSSAYSRRVVPAPV